MVRTGSKPEKSNTDTKPAQQNTESKPAVKKRRYRTRLHGSGYNSDDEYSRPRISQIDETGIQYISMEKLREQLHNAKGLEIHEMPGDGNCLFHSIADQIYGDNSFHDLVRELCMDYMEKERNHFSQFVTEDFSDYIKRKRCEGVQGNHLELQAISEIYSRAIEIYAINEDPLNIFQGSYSIDNPPIRVSYHSGNHYNSVRDPINPGIGVGLGFPLFKDGKKLSTQQIRETLLESEHAMITRLILERTQKESVETEIEHQIIAQTQLETEQAEIENQFLDQMQTESENDLFNQAIEQSKTDHDKQFSIILEQTAREQREREDAELKAILQQSAQQYQNQYQAYQPPPKPSYLVEWQLAIERAVMEQRKQSDYNKHNQ